MGGRRADTEVAWTARELEQLRDMKAEDLSLRLIALKLNRTLRAVQAKDQELRDAARHRL